MIQAMKPRMEMLAPKKLAGMKLSMSLMQNRTAELWRSFMPRRHEITNTCGTELYAVQVYDALYSFAPPDLSANFEKWAAVEVSDFSNIPEGMAAFELPEGLYAVFHYKGSSAEGAAVFGYIYGTWLPASGYEVDHRPQFEVLGEKYKNNDPESEEEIWIPVKPKS